MKPPVEWHSRDNRPAGPWALLLGLLLLGLILALVVDRYTPPEPLAADGPADLFSAGRALGRLEEILGDGTPHTVATEAAAGVRERVLEAFGELGVETEIQEEFLCRGGRVSPCARVVNVLASLPGREELPAVLVVTHYDSVGAGPGASDAGASVAAILEIARILKDGPALLRPVLFLVNEGEEAGLLGAQAFVESHPQAGNIFAVVNLEARGTSGASAMFETSEGNARLVRAWAGGAPKPLGNSTLYSLYRALPNDTDLTVFKNHGYRGLNFAFGGDLPRYHTPLDDLRHLDPRSLQHHGENALGTVRALAETAASPEAGNVVFFDVLAAAVVRWPLGWSVPVAAGGVILLILAATLLARDGRVRGIRAYTGCVAAFVAVMIGVAAGAGLHRGLVAATGERAPWTAHPHPALVACLAVTLGVALLLFALLAPRIDSWSAWTGCWGGWGLCAVILAILAPEPSYLLSIPVWVAALAGLALGRSGPAGTLTAFLLPLAAAGVLWAAIAYALWVMMGLQLSLAVTGPVAVLATTLLPLVPGDRWRWIVVGACLVVALAGFGLAVLVEPYSGERPYRLSLVHLQDADNDVAWWRQGSRSGPLPPELKNYFNYGQMEVRGYPAPEDVLTWEAGEAEPADLQPPELEVLQVVEAGEHRFVRLRVDSPRGGSVAGLYLHEDDLVRVADARVEGIPWPVPGRLYIRGLPPGGVEIEMRISGAGPVRGVLRDQSPGFPGEEVLDARPDWAVPTHQGDRTIVFRRVEF